MAATPDATSVAGSRRAETSVSKASAKPGSLESSRIRQASGRPAEGVDHRRDFGRAGLEGGAVDDEARGHLCDHLHLHKAVFLQRATRRHQIDDAAGEAQRRGKLHRDRKSVGQGTSVPVRVYIGGRRNLKKKT